MKHLIRESSCKMANRQRAVDLSNQPTRTASLIQETNVATSVKGSRTPNSGATMFGGKGDVLTDDWLFECKTQMKDKESFSVKQDWFRKNKEEQLYMRKNHSAVVFNFGPNRKNYYIIDENTFLQMQEALKKEENK